MPSPSTSDIGAQPPHQLLNVPFTSGVVKASVTLFMSTRKVTSCVGTTTLQALQEAQQTASRVTSASTFRARFVKPSAEIVQALPSVSDS